MQILDLFVEGLECPLGLDEKEPMFQWRVDGEGSMIQKGFQLQLSKEETFDNICFDTGIIIQQNQAWQGKLAGILEPRTRYYIRLRILDENDSFSRCSRTYWFETGLMGDTMGAMWIEPEQEDAVEEPECCHIGEVFIPGKAVPAEQRLRPLPQLRRSFCVSKEVRSARLYASARGIYSASLNGCKVDGRYFAPEITDYRKRFFYQTYDVGFLLKKGENRLKVILSDGWYTGRIGLSGDSCQYGRRLAFWGILEIKYTDGTSMRIFSDESFESGTGEYCYADLFMGEMHDLRKTVREWKPIRVLPACDIMLVGQKRPPVVELERLLPKRIFRTSKGETLIDFGKVLAGIVEMRAEGKSGTKIRLEFCEHLDNEGNYYQHIAGRNNDQVDTVILSGSGVELFHPQFTYHGFRYVKITGYPGELKKSNFCAVVLGTKLRSTLCFHCSDERINQLQSNIANSQRGNMISLPTDCPQREKSGFTGDIQVYGTTGCYNMDLEHFLEDYLREVRDAQEENGEVPNIAPNFPKMRLLQQRTNGCQSSAGWGDACILLPWIVYRMYGSCRVLYENYQMMKKWMAFVKTEAPDGIWKNDTHFGDWLIPSLTENGMNIDESLKELRYIVATCYYAKSAETLGDIAEILGENGDSSYYRSLAREIKDAFTNTFAIGEKLTVDYQGMYVLALAMDMVPEERAREYAERLNELIVENGYRLDTGFMSVRYLLKVLKDYGHQPTAARLLFQEECPSWLYQVNKGATSIWEKWDAVTPDNKVNMVSFNHYSFGCVGEFIYEEIAGVKPLAPGFLKTLIAPDFRFGLASLSLSYETPGGSLTVAWETKNDEIHLEVVVPFNVEAVLKLNGNFITTLEPGRYYYTIDEERKYV